MIRITRYRFGFKALDSIHLPAFPGSAIRGIFGHGLKRSVCVTQLQDCSACDLRRHCVYSYLFETPITVVKGSNAPHPLVLDVRQLKRNYESGETFSIGVTLVGKANRNLPYLIQAWQRAGQRGLGRGNARFALTRIDVLDFQSHKWRQIYPGDGAAFEIPQASEVGSDTQQLPSSAYVRLVTPYRSKRKGHLVTPETFALQGFMVSLIRRISALQELHDSDHPAIDVSGLIHAASSLVMTQPELRWREWIRRSSRQSTHMNMGGVTGAFTLSGDTLPQLWPLLQLGQWLHAGKNTMFGLGCYEIHAHESRYEQANN